MSKAEYTLLASVIGFYVLLFAYLLIRFCAASVRAFWPSASPQTSKASRPVARNRAWTRAVWRERLAPEMERGKQQAATIAV
ncbi:MAG TPA: hypothetical protein VE842_07380 [Pyrinomonadaceae bacterium]|jgi:hypothetical protein|nr:hypothetical protein [Pyrinomonadaceae bacterium]